MEMSQAIPFKGLQSRQTRMMVVEDDLSIQPVLERMIHKISPQVKVEWITSAEEAFEQLSRAQRNFDEESYSVVLSDVRLAGEKTGIDLVEDCYTKRVSANFVLASASAEVSTTLPFISKPYQFEDVRRMISPYLPGSTDEVSEPAYSLLERVGNWFQIERDLEIEWFIMVSFALTFAWTASLMGGEFKKLPFDRSMIGGGRTVQDSIREITSTPDSKEIRGRGDTKDLEEYKTEGK